METFAAAAVTMNSVHGEYEETFRIMEAFCQEAASQDVRLILFPELILHGHCNPETWHVAESVPDGPSVRRLHDVAHATGLVISAGMCEKEKDIVYNTQVLVGPEGYIGRQRKLHMSRDENLYYRGGREINVFDIGFCKVASVICYDNQFPEIARICALKGADIILMPHAAREGRWTDETQGDARRKVFDYFTGYRQRARENACYCIFADQSGIAGRVPDLPEDHHNQPHHPGGAMMISASGRIMGHATLDRICDEMIVHTLKAESLTHNRSHPNYTLRTRRPELFGELLVDQVSE